MDQTFHVAKIDEERQQVFGWAYISKENGKLIVDRQGDVIEPAILEKAAYDYVLNSRQGDTLHDEKPVATLIESVMFTEEKQAALGMSPGAMPEGWWVGFHVADAKAWKSVKKSGFQSFSIGGSAERETVELADGEFQVGKAGQVLASRNRARIEAALKLLQELMDDATPAAPEEMDSEDDMENESDGPEIEIEIK